MLNMNKSKTVIAKLTIDEPLDKSDKQTNIITFEGKCKKCGSGNNSLVVTSFVKNEDDKKMSLFKTVCLCCYNKDVYFGYEVKKVIE